MLTTSDRAELQGLRESKKRQTHAVIESAAWRLFARKGFDETTVEDIAAAAGVAPRTFFRYFETKEAVLHGAWRTRLDDFCARLRARPAHEGPLVAMATVVGEFLDRLEEDTTELLQRARIAGGSARFGRYRHEIVRPATVDAIAAVLAERLAVDVVRDFRPRLYAELVTVALDTARDTWVVAGGRVRLTDVVEQVFAELGAPVVNLPSTAHRAGASSDVPC